MPPSADPSNSDRGLLPVTRPAEYMERLGVHPHNSHERDIPGMVKALVAQAVRLGEDVDRAYDLDVNTNWRDYAKQLASRIKQQRGEIERLHRQVRELRADVHEAVERAETAERELSVIIEGAE